MQQPNKPQRKILVEFTFDWEDYEDVSDELILEDAGITTNMHEGVSAKIIQPNKD